MGCFSVTHASRNVTDEEVLRGEWEANVMKKRVSNGFCIPIRGTAGEALQVPLRVVHTFIYK